MRTMGEILKAYSNVIQGWISQHLPHTHLRIKKPSSRFFFFFFFFFGFYKNFSPEVHKVDET